MKILIKIENAINFLLLKLGQLMWKIVPAPFKKFWIRCIRFWNICILQVKKTPSLVLSFGLKFVSSAKEKVATVNLKSVASETITQAKTKAPKEVNKFKKLLMTPFLLLGNWLNGLSAGQSMLLLTFSSASFLAIIGIGFSGQKIMNTQAEAGRFPASLEDVTYDRPDYYKKDEKHLKLTNFRLPIYIPEVNQIRSVDIDFNATLSNRFSRNYLEKHEFHLRDHLILEIEPSIASFPIKEEGKEIIRLKLLKEVNDFLKLHKVEGEVEEIKITYILAN